MIARQSDWIERVPTWIVTGKCVFDESSPKFRMLNGVYVRKPRDVKAELKIGTKVDTDVNIVMNVVSFPTPTVTWLRMTEFVWTVLKDKYDYKHNISSTIRITSKDDFGVHGIKICNTLGCIVENITLQPEDKPEAPLYFSVEKQHLYQLIYLGLLDSMVDMSKHFPSSLKLQIVTRPQRLFKLVTLKRGVRNASLEFKTEVEYTGKSTSKTTSISTLSIVLACGYPVLFAVIIVLLVYINRRNKGSTGGSNPTNTNSTNSDEYTVIQRGNPTFTEPYSTLQSPTESTALQADSMETDTYDECRVGIAKTNKKAARNIQKRGFMLI
ncbi:TTN [Mytilus edulis]|uniref:TTN n=1 Tax=Mytilus edulis TaxID=6550 RepID=A0A8S3TAM7_MYTED|nr:TTN [Mytilus edulis]